LRFYGAKMSLIVQKFGGTSVADPERIMNVAKRVAKTYDQGNDVVVILSAMAGVTDSLIEMAQAVAESPDSRELDVLLATGEQTTCALLALNLKSMNYPAQSLMGHQVELMTDHCVCEIYTDVDGIYTADPNICDKARKLEAISYDEMLNMASLGAKVLQIRSVGFAKKYKIPVHVRSSFSEEEGTMVVDENSGMERLVVSGVTHDNSQARITLKKVPDQPGIAAKIFTPIAAAGIVVDMIIQNTRAGGQTDLTFTVPRSEYKKALELQKKVAADTGAEEVFGDQKIAKISVIGVGMKDHSGVASTMFSTLARENINIMMISTSEIRISCVIEEKYTELAVRVLHSAFGLDKE